MVSLHTLSRAASAAVILVSTIWTQVQAMTASMSDAQLVTEASAVVEARVQRLTPHWNEDRSLIFTTVDLTITRVLTSRTPFAGNALSIELLGGELDGVGLLSTESPSFQIGERVVVFARPWNTGRFVAVGGRNGILRVDETGRVQDRDINMDQLESRLRDLVR